MLIYLAGPMRGIESFNFPAFAAAAAVLTKDGHTVFNPAQRDLDTGFEPEGMTGFEDLKEHGFSLREALAADVEFITERAEMIVTLPEPEGTKSKGMAAEIALAEALGLPVMTYQLYTQTHPETAEEATLAVYFGWKADQAEGASEPIIMQPSADPGSDWSTGEVRTTSSTGGEKGMKPERFDLIPIGALTALARHYGVGALKYDDNQWRKGYEWSKSYAALMRHMTAWWNGEDYDPETGSSHVAAAAWHCFTLLTFIAEHPDFDDRYKGFPPMEVSA